MKLANGMFAQLLPYNERGVISTLTSAICKPMSHNSDAKEVHSNLNLPHLCVLFLARSAWTTSFNLIPFSPGEFLVHLQSNSSRN